MLQIGIAIENQRKAVMAVGFSRRGQANSTVLIVDTKPLKDTRQTAHITRGCKYSTPPYFLHCMTTPCLASWHYTITKLAPGTQYYESYVLRNGVIALDTCNCKFYLKNSECASKVL